MVTLIERESKTEIKQGQDNHTDEKAEIDLMDILRKIIGIRKIIYKAAGIGLLIGVIVAISIPENIQLELHFLLKWEILKAEVYPVWQLLFGKWSFYE